jgi:hypothetical protein
MLISKITFFLDCVRILKQRYEIANNAERKQLATFLKTWLFYNSGSKEIFWTGCTTEKGKLERVKEHRYSNLATTTYLLKTDLNRFSNKDLLLWTFEHMQWNYTSKEENNRLSKEQQYDNFYKKLDGDLIKLYETAKIELIDESENHNFYPKLSKIINNSKHKYYSEINMDSKNIGKFEQGLDYAANKLNIKLEYLKVPKRGYILGFENYSDFFKAVTSGFLFCMNKSLLERFLEEYNYSANESKGPYRYVNNYTKEKYRVYEVQLKQKLSLYLSTYNSTVYKIDLLEKMAQFFDAEIYYYDNNLIAFSDKLKG